MSEKQRAYAIAGEILSMLEDHFGSFGESNYFRRAYILTDPVRQVIEFYVSFPMGEFSSRQEKYSVTWPELTNRICAVTEWFTSIRDYMIEMQTEHQAND